MQLPGTMLYPKRLSVKATDGCINVFGNSPTYVVMPAQAGIQTPLSSLCTSNAPVYVPGILRRFPQNLYAPVQRGCESARLEQFSIAADSWAG